MPVHQEPAVYIPQPAVVKEVAPVAYSEYREPESYVYAKSSPVSYQKQVLYSEPLPVTYQKQAALVYNEQVPVSYQKQSEFSYEPSVVYKQPVVYGAQPYGPAKYSDGGYYHHGY